MNINLKKKEMFISLIGVISLILIVVGVSYSFFSYTKEGTLENSIKTGNITFKYTEGTNIGNGITITEALPISDEVGKAQTGEGKIFDFKVEATSSRSDMEYEVVAEPTENSTLPLDAIKFYLTDITSGVEEEIDSTLAEDGSVRTLDSFSDTTIKNANGKTIYQETILKNTKGYLKQFRARMWLKDGLDWTDDKYISKSGAIRINVYANSERDMASTETTTSVDTSIERVTANSMYLFTEAEEEEETYQYSLTVPNEVDELDIDVIASNMDATVEITPIEDDSYSFRSNVRFLSTFSVQGRVYELKVGETYFNAKVTSSDKSKSQNYILKVIREQSGNTELASLEVVGYELSPSYSNEETLYQLEVPYETTTVTVEAELKESVQQVSGTGEHELVVGSNVIKVVVTAENGNTKTIQITVNRKTSDDASISNVGVLGYTLAHLEGNVYYIEVPYNTETVIIDNVSKTGATVSGIGEKSNLEVGNNNYTVKVTSQSGNVSNEYVIRIVRLKDTDNTLSSLVVDSYEITPKFDKEVLIYSVTVENSVTSVEVQAQATSSVATVEGIGSKELEVGENTVNIKVTSQSGSIRNYVVTINRLPNEDATLKSLDVTGYQITPSFEKEITSYTLSVPYSVTSVEVTADTTESVATVDGTGSKELKVGENEIKIVVTAEDKTTTKTYTIVVTREKDTEATLSSLSLTGGCTLSPSFSSDATSYSCTVENSVTSVEVQAQATSSVATVSGTGEKTLNVGTNTVSVKVTAQDGTTTKTYTVTVNRKASSDATLKGLSVEGYTISPDFSSDETSYTLSVPYSVTSVEVTADTTESVATVEGTGSKELKVGENEIKIVVTAEDKTTTKTYTIVVTREKDTEAILSNLSLTGCTLSPNFSSDTTSYSCTVGYSTSTTTVSATATSSVATITGTGSKELQVGNNIITVNVKSQDEKKEQSYTIVVTREKDTTATLSSLSLTGGCTLSPTFVSGTTSYSCTVENSVTSTTVSATTTSSVATLEGTGSKSLSVGANTVNVKVTAQDGTTTKTYTVTVTRKPNSDATLKSLGVTGQTLSPTFASGTTSYTVTVPYSVDSVTVTGTATQSVSSVEGLGSKTLIVGENTVSVKVTAQDGTTSKTYTIKITRSEDTDSSIKSLSVTGYSIVKVDDNHYTLTVENSVTSVVVNATATSSVATVSGTGTKTLSVGENTVKVQVTAQDGTISIYEIVITRKASSDATLKGLSVEGYTISPTFASGTISYSLTVPNSVTSITVNATVNNSEAKAVVSGNTSLAAGSNSVKVVVTAGDGTTKTYTITVKRMKADTITLSAKSTTYTGSRVAANTASATSNSTITYTYYSTTDCSGTAISQPINVGNYSVKATSAGNSDYESGSKCVTHTITQGTPTISLTAKSTTYTGSAIAANTATATQPNGTAVTLSYIYTYYSDSSCTTSIGTTAPTNAGTYYVKAVSTATTNLKSASSACTKHTISKKADTITLSAKSTTYTGSQVAANTASSTSGTTITYTYYSTTDCSGTALSSAPTNVGNYSVKATSAGNTNYSAGSICVTHTITQGTPTISLTAKSTTYTGSLIATNTATAKNPNGTAVTLSYTYTYYTNSSCSSGATTTAPTSVGTYYVKAVSTATSDLVSASSACTKHTITQGTPTISLTAKNTTYTGSAISANTATAKNPNGVAVTLSYTYTYYTNSACSSGATTTAPTNVGTYYVKAVSTATTNLKSASSSCVAHTITQGTPTISLAAKSTIYTGSAISANTATAKNPNGVAVTLSYTYTYYTNSACSTGATTTAPTSVGTYYVKAVSTATSNLVSASSSCVAHTITKGTPTVTVSNNTATYTGNSVVAGTVTVKAPNGTVITGSSSITITYYSDSSCSTTISSAPTNVGTYYAKATTTATTNLNSGSSNCASIVISKGTPTISLTAKSTQATGSAIAANTATATQPNGTAVKLSYTYTYYSDSSCATSIGTTAPSAVGTYYVKAVSTATSNLNSASSACTTHTITANTNNNLSSLSVTGYSISPTFAAATTSYTLTVEAKSIVVNATAATSLATVSGAGTQNLSWGTNTISISVTSQSGSIKTYKITVTNTQPTAPTITGGSSSWVSSVPTISVSTAGSAISGVSTYEYYMSSSSTTPTNATLSSGTESVGTAKTGSTQGNLSVTTEGTRYIWYRTVSNNGLRSNWTGPQVTKLDTANPTTPTLALSDFKFNTDSLYYIITTSSTDSVSEISSYAYSINNGASFIGAGSNIMQILQTSGAEHNTKTRVYDATGVNYSDSTTTLNLTPKKILIGQLYQKILGRTPSQSEMDSWATNTYGNYIAYEIANSTEAINRLTTTEAYITAYYEGILGRTPSSSEITEAVSHANSVGREEYLKSITNSTEFVDNLTLWGVPYQSSCTFTSQTFAYTGNSEEFEVPCSGTYKLEVWGAQGGQSPYGTQNANYGGYSYGNISLTSGTKLYIAVGGQGTVNESGVAAIGGYNGGGASGAATYTNWIASGGGATHIATGTTNRGELKNYESYKSEILIVAGGGGGTAQHEVGGAGGGLTGGSSSSVDGATQTTGYAFGEGQSSLGVGYLFMSGGGGGYYGGYGNTTAWNSGYSGRAGSGGSGYIGGVTEGNTTSGQQAGDGYATITLISQD